MTANINSSYLSRTRLNATTLDGTNNDRMQKLAEKLGRMTNVIQNEKSSKFDQYEQKSTNLYNSIEETKNNNNNKFNQIKEQILIIQKTLEDDKMIQEGQSKILKKFDDEFKSKNLLNKISCLIRCKI